MATTNYWLQPDRQLDIRGTILFADNTTKSLTSSDIIRYEINRQNALNGFPTGECVSGAFTLEIDNADHTLEQNVLYGAKITIEIGIYYTNAWHWSPFGVWFISEVDAQEQSTIATISGYDAIGTNLDTPIDVSVFNDITVQETSTWRGVTYHLIKARDVIAKICDVGNCTYNSSYSHPTIITSTKKISREDIKTYLVFEKNCTYRSLLSNFARMGFGFYYITDDGMLRFRRYATGTSTSLSLDPSTYIVFNKTTLKGFESFYYEYNIRWLSYAAPYDPDADYSAVWSDRAYYYVVINDGTPQQNTPQPDAYNTLFGGTIFYRLQQPETSNVGPSIIINYDTHITSEGADCEFQGDPTISLGEKVSVTDKAGVVHKFNVTSISATFDGGLSMRIGCELPQSLDSDFKVFTATTTSQELVEYRQLNNTIQNDYVPGQ